MEFPFGTPYAPEETESENLEKKAGEINEKEYITLSDQLVSPRLFLACRSREGEGIGLEESLKGSCCERRTFDRYNSR